MVTAVLLALLPAGASAAELLSGRVASASAAFRECSEDPLPDGVGFVQHIQPQALRAPAAQLPPQIARKADPNAPDLAAAVARVRPDFSRSI